LLVLSRRAGESIMIGHDVVVTVLEVRPDLVRIGIKAPRDIEVHREEVFIEVQQANRSAASPSAKDVEALAAGLRDNPREQPDGDAPA
jgi:carbon storage regulator